MLRVASRRFSSSLSSSASFPWRSSQTGSTIISRNTVDDDRQPSCFPTASYLGSGLRSYHSGRYLITYCNPICYTLGRIKWDSAVGPEQNLYIITPSDMRKIFFEKYLPLFYGTTLEDKFVHGKVENFCLPTGSSILITILDLMGWLRGTQPSQRWEIFHHINVSNVYIMENICGTADYFRGIEMLDFWKPPPPGWTKFNTDGSYPRSGNDTSFCACLRIYLDGRLPNHHCVPVTNANRAEDVELCACFEAVSLAKNEGIKHVIIETDCLNVVKKIKGIIPLGEKDDRSRYSKIWNCINVFPAFQIHHIYREVNCVADFYAKSCANNKKINAKEINEAVSKLLFARPFRFHKIWESSLYGDK